VSINFGKELRDPKKLQSKFKHPDPTAYNPHKSMYMIQHKAPSFGMGTEKKNVAILRALTGNVSPGPGSCNPSHTITHKKGPHIGFGTSKRQDINGKTT